MIDAAAIVGFVLLALIAAAGVFGWFVSDDEIDAS